MSIIWRASVSNERVSIIASVHRVESSRRKIDETANAYERHGANWKQEDGDDGDDDDDDDDSGDDEHEYEKIDGCRRWRYSREWSAFTRPNCRNEIR